jgi:hypothetical protein
MNTRISSAVLTVVVGASVLSGCASSKRGLEPRDYWPSGERWKHAATRALTDRGTWIPLAGAAVVSIDDWDREISDWAVENTPIFGSDENARQASDTLWIATQLSMAGTALAVPSGNGAWEWKPERLLLASGHASQAFTMARMACLNTDDLTGLSRGWRLTLKTTFTTLAGATAWSRVEGGKHYPSDVLVGAALGNFVAIFVHDAFLPAESNTRFNATLGSDEISFSVAFRF